MTNFEAQNLHIWATNLPTCDERNEHKKQKQLQMKETTKITHKYGRSNLKHNKTSQKSTHIYFLADLVANLDDKATETTKIIHKSGGLI